MKKAILFLLLVVSFTHAQTSEKQKISETLDNWHASAANAQFDSFFGLMADDAVFIGTDATENWTKNDFKIWAKPFFDKGKTWNFTAVERHIFLDQTGKIAWFDELLDTWMKICRGSGVLVKIGEEWKIQHYVLSTTIPNDNVDVVVQLKAPIETTLLDQLRKK
jgi:ketosteroid isomerase-like protein